MLPSEMLRRTLEGDRAAAREFGRWLDAIGSTERVTGVVQQPAAAYAADDESTDYTGNGDGLAYVTDVNALRAAYETLRAMTEDVRTKLIAAKVLS